MKKITFKAACLTKKVSILPLMTVYANMKSPGWSDWAFEIGWLYWYVGFRVNNNVK